jgi:hypothetical protein
MQRRTVLKTAAALAATGLARPAIAQPARVLKYAPHANLTSLDPVWTTAAATPQRPYLRNCSAGWAFRLSRARQRVGRSFCRTKRQAARRGAVMAALWHRWRPVQVSKQFHGLGGKKGKVVAKKPGFPSNDRPFGPFPSSETSHFNLPNHP